MKIAYIVPGFGGTFYCHNCRTGTDWVGGMEQCGEQAVLVPLYMPLPRGMTVGAAAPVFYGAVGVYLAEAVPALRHAPAWLDRMLNCRLLLNWIARRSAPTDPVGLEQMTLSVMRGDSGSALEQLLSWLTHIRPDVAHLANALLVGIGCRIKQRLNIPVFCNLDDEHFWIDDMRPPYAETAWQLIRSGAASIDAYISASHYYAELVRAKTGLPAAAVRVVPRGIDLERYIPATPGLAPPVIGFLSRMCHSMGLDILAEAFVLLKQQPAHQQVKLRITGGMAPPDKAFVAGIVRMLKKNGVWPDVELRPMLFNDNSAEFFRGLTLLCVPARKAESFGSYMLEAMASGIPVVQPRRGGYPEILAQGGGVAYTDNTPAALSRIVSALLADREQILAMSAAGLAAVKNRYSRQRFSRELLSLYNAGRVYTVPTPGCENLSL